MQPERLFRLEKVVKTPHLARKIRNVKFTLDIWEGRNPGEIHVVGKMDSEDYGSSTPPFGGFTDTRSECQHDVYVWKLSDMSTYNAQDPDAVYISRILALLKGTGARLDLDMLSDVLFQPTLRRRQHIAPKMLQILQAASYPLHALALQGLSMDCEAVRDDPAVAAQISALKQFTYDIDAGYMDADEEPDTHETALLGYVLRIASNLRYLDITIDTNQTVLLSMALSQISCLPVLRELEMPGFGISYAAAASMLEACTSLRTLSVDKLLLQSGSGSQNWYEILRILQALPELACLNLSYLHSDNGKDLNATGSEVGREHSAECEELDISSSSREETVRELDWHTSKIELSRKGSSVDA